MCMCVNQAQRVLMILCSALVLTLPFMSLHQLCFIHSVNQMFGDPKSFQQLGEHIEIGFPNIICGLSLEVMVALHNH